MYSDFDISTLLESASTYVLQNDRMLYKPFFEAAERFCIDNNVILGGKVGIDLLVGKELSKDSFYWDLYTENTFDIAKKLTDALTAVHNPHIKPEYTYMRTDIKHKEFTIVVNTRTMFKVYSLDRYRGIRLVELMGPAARTSYFTRETINCISEEIQLVEIYRTLYSPSKVNEFPYYFQAENKIYELAKESLRTKATKIVGAGGASNEKFNLPRDDLIIQKLIKGSNSVLVGDRAMKMLGVSTTVSQARLQIITSTPIKEFANSVENLLTRQRNNGRSNSKITYIKYPLNIPHDFQITKHTLYVSTDKDQFPFMDVFNSTTYEMIPTSTIDDVLVANPLVILRFKFIDLWVLKLILNLDNNENIRQKIMLLLDHIQYTRTYMLEKFAENPHNVFQLSNYVGTFINETVAKKKMILTAGDRFPNYYSKTTNETDNQKINKLSD